MAYATHITHSDQVSDVTGFSIFLFYLRASAAQRRAYSRTLRELQASSNRDLADLGFHYSEIPRIAREAAYGA